MRTLGWLPALLVLAAVPANAADNGRALRRSGAFDAPLRTERRKIPDSESGKARLSCFSFDRVRMKQLDLGEVGAAELAILPLETDADAVPCRRETAAGEIVIPADRWSGYFKGVRSGYVFFDAEDGANGGFGFAVFDGSTGRKLCHARDWQGNVLPAGGLMKPKHQRGPRCDAGTDRRMRLWPGWR
ncbi:MAG TPA: hypothetical protein VE993_21220 [Stellaceae bacterium]|nr:hypothetical protein [Stellaceae bacterium]